MARIRRTHYHRYPFWTPRFWHGMRLRPWLRLLARHKFHIHPLRWPMAAIVTGCAVINSSLTRLQRMLYGRRIDKTNIHPSPVFILGHWRSGTTFLHELLSLDERFVSPTTYQCFAPSHFVLSQWLLTRLLWILIPARRPMDNVKMGWDQPMEDEFALCIMGVPSPYVRMAFPNHPPEYLEYLNMENLSAGEVKRWQEGLLDFMRRISYRHGKPILLKSPTHTGRIKVLLQMFPEARFVHITRNPLAVVPSTLRLWQSLDSIQGLQLPNHDELEAYVFDSFEKMYAGFDKGRGLIDEAQLCDVRYEDLVKDPVTQLRSIYDSLDLGDFESVRSRVEAYASQMKDYKINQHELPARLQREISHRWAEYMERYGYCRTEATV